MKSLRTIVYLASLLVGGILYLSTSAPVRTWHFELLAYIWLYLSLVPGAVYALFPNAPFRVVLQKAKKALGISSFFFSVVFVVLLRQTEAGANSASPLSPVQVYAGAIAFVLLGILTVTSIKSIKHHMRPWWKPLHRTVYIAGVGGAVFTAGVMCVLGVSKGWWIVFLSSGLILVVLQLIRFGRFLALNRERVGKNFPG